MSSYKNDTQYNENLMLFEKLNSSKLPKKFFLILTDKNGIILKFTNNTPNFIASKKDIFSVISNVKKDENCCGEKKQFSNCIYDVVLKSDDIKKVIRLFPFELENFYLIFAEDITEKLLIEEYLNERIKTLSNYLEFAPVFFVVLNKNGNIEYINHWALKSLGYKLKDVIQKNWFELFIPEDIKEEIKGVFQNIMEGKIELVSTYENVVLTKDGRQIDVLWENKLLLKDGVPSGTISVGVDITDKKIREFEEKVVASILNTFSEPDYQSAISKIGNILRTKCNVVRAHAEVKTSDEIVRFNFIENTEKEINSQNFFETSAVENVVEKVVHYEEKEVKLILAYSSLPKYATEQCMTNVANILSAFVEKVYYIKKLEEASFKDALTGLYNRRYFMIMLKNEIKRVKRYGYHSSVVMIDLDGLKEINDSLGHDNGDIAIKSISNAIISTIRTTDVGARFGGDEFTILLPHTDKSSVESIIDRMRTIVKNYKKEKNLSFEINFSAGYTMINKKDDDDGISVLKRADEMLYKAKKAGKNQTFGE